MLSAGSTSRRLQLLSSLGNEVFDVLRRDAHFVKLRLDLRDPAKLSVGRFGEELATSFDFLDATLERVNQRR
jgi:hypothetical protein